MSRVLVDAAHFVMARGTLYSRVCDPDSVNLQDFL